MKDKILQLLGAGHSNAIVASAVGCTESYVSQLLSDEEFSKQVIELKVQNLQAASQRDHKYDSMEDDLMDKLKESIPMLFKPLEIVRVLKVVNEAKRRGAQVDNGMQTPNNFIKLNMPQFVQQNFILNERNEVVEVEGRSMVSIDAKKLITELGPQKKEEEQLSSTQQVMQHRLPPVRVITPPNQEVLSHESISDTTRERAVS